MTEGSAKPRGRALPFSSLHRLLLPRLGYDKRSLHGRVKVIIALARAEWVRLAEEQFNSTKADYIRAITPVQWVGQTTAQIALVGKWPNALERGKSAWDMRTTLLVPGKVKSVRRSKDGYLYLAVPFRHKGPGGGRSSMGGSQGFAMGGGYGSPIVRAAQRNLGRAILREAGQLTATLSDPAGPITRISQNAAGQTLISRTRWGGRLEAGLAPLAQEHHAGDIYAGMVRLEKTYRNATQNQFMTWRMITNNPATFRGKKGEAAAKPANWIHPGIKAANLLARVREYIHDTAIPQMMDPAQSMDLR